MKMKRLQQKNRAIDVDGRSGYPFIWVFLCAAITVLVLWLALMPAASAPSAFGWDKLNHAGAIAVVTGLAYLSLQPRRWAAATSFIYGTSLGILIEILQATLTTGRAAEWGDVAADLVGAGSAWFVIRVYRCKIAPQS